MVASSAVPTSVGDGDGSIGPQLGDKHDLTLLFEHIVLTMIPTILLIIAAPFHIHIYGRQPVLVKRCIFYWAKLATSGVLIIIEISSLVLWCQSKLRTPFSIVAAVLSLLTAMAISVLLNAEHRRALRPSAIVSLYVTIAIILDIVKVRSYFFRHSLNSIAGLLCGSVAAKAALLVFGEKSKRAHVMDPVLQMSLGKEAFSGFWNRSLFVWLNSTIFIGFRRIISVDDLDNLDPEFASEELSVAFQNHWKYADKNKRHCLMQASFLSLRLSCSKIVLPRFCHIAFAFTQPYLLQRVVSYLGREDKSDAEGNALIGATILLYISLLVSKAWHEHSTNRLTTFLRGMLVTAVFEKTMVLECGKVKQFSGVTVMSTDVDGVTDGARYFVDILACSIEAIVGLTLLSLLVKSAAFLVVMPPLVLALATYRLVKQVPQARVSWNEDIESRVTATSKLIAQIKSIKMVGYAVDMANYLQSLREKEVEGSKKYRLLSSALVASALLSYCLTPIVVIAGALFWTTFDQRMNPVDVFTTLSIVGLVAFPVGKLMASFHRIGAAFGCFQRLEAFLILREKQDKRKILHRGHPRNVAPNNLTEKNGDGPPVTEPQSPDAFPVEFLGASIAHEADRDTVVNNASFRILRSKLTVIFGPTASGKSTIMHAILGENHIVRGTVHLEHDWIAYCDQTSWIRNRSVRENIVAESTNDTEWYRTVVRACCLEDDIQNLSNADETLAGSGGVNLSGGQRQRIALARAIYSRAPLVLLDDVFSAVDQRTAVTIFANLFSPDGLIRRMKRTVVLATHSEIFARAADQILTLDEGGHVSSAQRPEDAGLGSALTTDAMLKLPDTHSVQTPEEAVPETPAVKEADVEEEDLTIRQRGDFSLYTLYFKPVVTSLLILWLFTTALYSLAERASDIYMRIWLEVDPDNNHYFIGYATLGVVSGFCPMAMLSVFWLLLAPQSSEGLHKMLVDTAMSATLPFLTSTDIGYLLNRFSQDMTLVSQGLPEALWIMVYDFLLMVIDIGIITSGSRYLAIAVPFIFGSLYFLQLYYLRTSRQMRHLDLEAKSPLYTEFTESATGIEHIRCFGWQKSARDKLYKLLDISQKPFYSMLCLQRWLAVAMDMIALVMATMLVSFALSFVGSSQSGLGLSLLNLTTFSPQLICVVVNWANLETAFGAIARLRTFMSSTPVERDETECPPHLPERWPDNGEVEFRHLTVGYGSTKVIQNFSMKIKGGKRVGIVGRTGSGKSTMFLALLKFLNYSGSIVIDGFEISDIPHDVLRSRITTIPQDFIEYPGSVRNNLVPQDIMKAKEASVHDTTVLDILKQVGSGLFEEVAHRGGLDGSFEALGLSEGQKQIFSVARAIIDNIIKGTKLILVDEATSSVDLATDQKIQSLMKRHFRGCTIMIISHRVETLKDAYAVYSLDRNVIYQ